jgi:nitrile hydratase subunit alpha
MNGCRRWRPGSEIDRSDLTFEQDRAILGCREPEAVVPMAGVWIKASTMSPHDDPLDRRDFLKGVAMTAAAMTTENSLGSTDAGHHHEHHHDHQVVPSDLNLRVKALESLLVEKGVVDRAALDAIVDTYETKIGPRNGARVVARAWVDPAYRQRLLNDASAAIAELGYTGGQGEDIVVLENGPKVHNLVVCTLCSCYPWPVLGLPPVWYKSSAYRSRAVIDPRGVLREFGLELADDTEIRVWDSTSEVRYIVLPERPAGTEHMTENQLAELVTRDAMVGTAVVAAPGARIQ